MTGIDTAGTGTSTSPSRPTLAFRVGVTGARNLDAFPQETLNAIRSRVRNVLEVVRNEVDSIAGCKEAQAVYALTGSEVKPCLRIVSPLAEGADRLVADVATELGYRLDVVLPFPRDEYVKDFAASASRAEFDRLLGTDDAHDVQTYLALDGDRNSENRSYEAIGRLVVRNCDLLIAIWDGASAKGRGGTGDIVRFSARFGPPIWWIDVDEKSPPRFVTATAQLRATQQIATCTAAAEALVHRIHGTLLPNAHHAHRHGLLGWVIDRMHTRLGWDDNPYHIFLTETPRPRRLPWDLYSHFLRVMGGPLWEPDGPATGGMSNESSLVADRSAAYWDKLYKPADRGSTDYGNRYRSSYIMIFALATLAASCAILALTGKSLKLPSTITELITLVLILWLVLLNQRRFWHQRWLAYRLLAELCRKQGALAMLGWSLPPSNLKRFDTSAEAWVGWYFNAALRAAPLPRGSFTTESLELIKAFVKATLLAGQARYHRDRKLRSARAARWLAVLGESLFVFTLIAVAMKLGLILSDITTGKTTHSQEGLLDPILLLGLAAAILPAMSAALLGLRAYSELELLEQQSARMEKVMTDAATALDTIRLDCALASQDLAAEVFDVATEMLQDVGGWADLFRVKAVEAG